MSNDDISRIGRYVVWSIVIFMNVTGWIFPFLFPDGYLHFVEFLLPYYVEQIISLRDSPIADNSHRFFGGILLLLGALQFESGIRKKYAVVHRVLGIAYLVLGLVTALTAIAIAQYHAFGGFITKVFTIGVASMYIFMLLKAFMYAKVRNFQAHREWMVRGFSFVLLISTFRMVIPIMYWFGGFDVSPADLFNAASIIALFINVSIGEWWIDRTRPKRQVENLSGYRTYN
ncbi:MAG: hypothetical protein C9356_15605 [Oleiphilus sp.]|nr:MAG: hypothetical protein C9356_15605 [Oleiphilus sp.]